MEQDSTLNLIEVAMRESGLYGDFLSDIPKDIHSSHSVNPNSSVLSTQNVNQLTDIAAPERSSASDVLPTNAERSALNFSAANTSQIIVNKSINSNTQNGNSFSRHVRPVIIDFNNMNTVRLQQDRCANQHVHGVSTDMQRIIPVSLNLRAGIQSNRTSICQVIRAPSAPSAVVRVSCVTPSCGMTSGQLLTSNSSLESVHPIKLGADTGVIRVPSVTFRSVNALKLAASSSMSSTLVPMPASTVQFNAALKNESFPSQVPVVRMSQANNSTNRTMVKVIPVANKPRLFAASGPAALLEVPTAATSAQFALSPGLAAVAGSRQIILRRMQAVKNVDQTVLQVLPNLTGEVNEALNKSVHQDLQDVQPRISTSLVQSGSSMSPGCDVSSFMPSEGSAFSLDSNSVNSQSFIKNVENKSQTAAEDSAHQSSFEGSLALTGLKDGVVTTMENIASGIQSQASYSGSDSDDSNDILVAIRKMRKMNKEADNEVAKRTKELQDAHQEPGATSVLIKSAEVTKSEILLGDLVRSGHSLNISTEAQHLTGLQDARQFSSASNLMPFVISSGQRMASSTSGITQGIATETYRIFTSSDLMSGIGETSLLPSVSRGSQAPRAIYINRRTGAISFDDSVQMQGSNPTGMSLPGAIDRQLLFPGLSSAELGEEEEELGHAETYESYKPAKLTISHFSHPDKVVESSSLSSIQPPDIDYQYRLAIPEAIIDEGRLSALQLEAIVYTCQQHEKFLPNDKERVGFLIGDGAGVGKGRTIAGIILENYTLGRKRALWLSVSNDLLEDARRDLNDVGASHIKIFPLNKFKYGKINSTKNQKFKKGVIFGTYSSLIGESHTEEKYKTRMRQLTHWLGKEFEGLIIFDECHRAKNLFSSGSTKATKTGQKVVELQTLLPKARVVYASATGASEPKNMGYMTRLGLWGPGTAFSDFDEFHSAIKKRGVGAMELVAMEMKQRGTYMARQLSFEGVNFDIVIVELSKDFIQLYNDCVTMWVKALNYFQVAIELLNSYTSSRDSEKSFSNCHSKEFKKSLAQYWSAHQRFFRHICISAKVPWIVKFVSKKIDEGFSIVIGLQSTGEAKMLEQLDISGYEMSEFVSTVRGVFQALIEKHFPTIDSFEQNKQPHHRKDDLMSHYLKKRDIVCKQRQTINGPSQKKRMRLELSDDDSSISDSSVENDTESVEISNEGTDEDSAEMYGKTEKMTEDSEGEDSESDDDRNPFAEGSESDFDDEPAWVRRPKKKLKLEQTQQSEKKSSKQISVKRKKNKKPKENSSGDEFTDDFEKQAARDVRVLLKKESVVSEQKSQKLSLNNINTEIFASNMSIADKIMTMKNELLRDVEELGPRLPSNTLDELIERLGGKERVAEMTGRKGRMVMTASGTVHYESRADAEATLENINNTERQKFMDGVKRIAVISEAASSGISLHADRRARNHDKRIHITLELPWSADRAIQQFGRTHRSNQVWPPEYIFVISELAGEQRFAATVAKRLESLGALTHGDRRAAETRDLSQFNIDNKYGQEALKCVFQSINGVDKPLVKPPTTYDGNFFEDVQKALNDVGIGKESGGRDKDHYQISKFLNRILGMEVHLQNALFHYFTSTLEEVIMAAKREGTWDLGILDLGSCGEKVHEIESKEFSGFFSGFHTKIQLTTVSVERGINWSEATGILNKHRQYESGFYRLKMCIGNKILHILAIGVKRKNELLYKIYRPNVGVIPNLWSADELKKKYVKVSNVDDAKVHWDDQYTASETMCSHFYQFHQCRNRSCESGKRNRLYHILSGSVLSIWTSVEKLLREIPGANASRMQVIRLKIIKENSKEKKEKRIVGTLIPPAAVEPLLQFLKGLALSKSQSQGESSSTNYLVNPTGIQATNNPSNFSGIQYANVANLRNSSSSIATQESVQPQEKPLLNMPKFF